MKRTDTVTMEVERSSSYLWLVIRVGECLALLIKQVFPVLLRVLPPVALRRPSFRTR